jgi:putative sterol carrier protein
MTGSNTTAPGTPFATLAWGAALMDRINVNDDYARLAANWQGAILFHDTETGRFVWLDIHEGKCRDVAAWNDTQDAYSREAPFVFSARTATWRKLCEATMHPTTALATRRLKVTGDMIQVMCFAQATVAMVKSAQEVPTLWP